MCVGATWRYDVAVAACTQPSLCSYMPTVHICDLRPSLTIRQIPVRYRTEGGGHQRWRNTDPPRFGMTVFHVTVTGAAIYMGAAQRRLQPQRSRHARPDCDWWNTETHQNN